MEHLGHPPLRERLDAKVLAVGRSQLPPPGAQGRLELLVGGLARERDEQCPAPRVPLTRPEDQVEVEDAVAGPPQALERSDLRHHAPSLEREAQRPGGRVEARHPGREPGLAGRPLAVDHHEPAPRQLEEPDDAGLAGEFRGTGRRDIERDGVHQVGLQARTERGGG
jgi:hypothetical protein